MIDGAWSMAAEEREIQEPAALFERLAGILNYPNEETENCVQSCQSYLSRHLPEAARLLASFRSYFSAAPLWSIQELFTQTFDLSPVCCLEVGYHLFGEDYQRGLFLAQLRESQEEAGMESEVELPDHLSVVLRWLARVYGTELHTEMVTECLLPAMWKMEESFADGDNPYRNVLKAVFLILEDDLKQRGIRFTLRKWESRTGKDIEYSGCHAAAIPGCNAQPQLISLQA